jgi:hypothetical protein
MSIAFAAAFGGLSLACSDDPRIAAGDLYLQVNSGVPGASLIDDMEDGNQYLLSDNGLVGLWYTYNDESVGSLQEPALGFPMYRILTPEGAPLSTSLVPPRPCGETPQTPFFAPETDCAFVARTAGTGQRGWGAGMGLDLNGEGGTKNPFDASDYGGIGFYVMGTMRNQTLRVNVQDVRTTPESAEAADRRNIDRCESFRDDGSETGRCNDHYGFNVTALPDPAAAEQPWVWVEIPFSCMTASNFGYTGDTPGLLTTDIVGVQFQIGGADPDDNPMTAALPLLPFDFSIDNLAFLEKSRTAAIECN